MSKIKNILIIGNGFHIKTCKDDDFSLEKFLNISKN